MQSEHPIIVSHNLRTTTENDTDIRAGRRVEPDIRRFAGIFPSEAPEVPAHRGDATHEEHEGRGHDSDSDDSDPSRWEFVSILDNNTSTTQVTSAATVDENPSLSAAQQIIACYRAVHGNDPSPDSTTMETEDKSLPQISDDQRSMYTLATSAETPTAMDMMWKPRPKVHMHRTDQRALMQAQTQAIAMMHNAGLKPTNKIQCRRRGCANILPDVDALKYHLHIHNIADTTARCNDASSSVVPKPSLTEGGTCISKASKRSRHSRSKSSLATHHSCLTACPPPRKLSASGLIPSLFSPRASSPNPQRVPNLTTIAAALVSDPGCKKSVDAASVSDNSKTPSTLSTPSHGRRTRKESQSLSVGTECNRSIAMLLSSPTLPRTQRRLVLTPRTNSPMPHEPNPVLDGGMDDCVPNENVRLVREKLPRARSPVTVPSPTRAMSPIRNGIRRVLSLGYSVDFAEK